ncbi:MAG TPA: 3-oxoacyl-ACP reductase, partial [Cellulomonas sp.]|nr:3-oxoacyl-ACP reductase [Cellulomonas sp.]
MSDTYLNLVNSGFTKKVAKQLGLPQPAPLRRYRPGQPLLDGPALVLGAGSDADAVAALLSTTWDLEVHRHATPEVRYAAVVLVLTEVLHPSDLGEPVLAAGGVLKSLARGGRVVTVSRTAAADDAPALAAARQGVDGLLRSLAKELRGGSTGNGIVLDAGVGVDAPSVVGAL